MNCGCIIPSAFADLAPLVSSAVPVTYTGLHNLSNAGGQLSRSGGTANTNDAYGFSSQYVEGTACGYWEFRTDFNAEATNNLIYYVIEDEYGTANRYGWYLQNGIQPFRRSPYHGTTADFPIYYGPAGGAPSPDQVGYNVGFRFGIYYNNGTVRLYENSQFTNDTNSFIEPLSYKYTGLPTDRRWRLKVYVFPSALTAHSTQVIESIAAASDVCATADFSIPALQWDATATVESPPAPPPAPPLAGRGILMYDTRELIRGWFPFHYNPEINLVYFEEGVATMLLGGADGRLYLNVGNDDDAGTAIVCQADTFTYDAGDPRSNKQFANGSVEVDGTIGVQAIADNGTTGLGTTSIAVTDRTRQTLDFIQEEHKNLMLRFTGNAPLTLYNYSMEATFVSVSEMTEFRKAFATSLELEEYGHLYRAQVAYISTNAVSLIVTIDNGLSITYPLVSSGGALLKTQVIFQALKGKLFEVQFHSIADFQLIRSQTVFFLKEFRSAGPYELKHSFGDVSPAA